MVLSSPFLNTTNTKDGMMVIMGFPLHYMQGRGIIQDLGRYIAPFGRRPLLIIDAFFYTLKGPAIEESLAAHGIDFVLVKFSGETSPNMIQTLTDLARERSCDVSIGVGGGKVQDVTKSLKLNLGLSVVIVPTIASNDAATSRMIITYTDSGDFLGPLVMDSNPEAVLVDVDIIADAPPRFLVAGIGDALATFFEAEQCRLSQVNNFFGGEPTEVALTLARRCYELIRSYGEEAVRSARDHRMTPALEKVIEANVLFSGLGFEGCGVAAAHALSQGYSRIPELRGSLHGEEVALGLLTQLVLEGRTDEFITELMEFYLAIGLPISLCDLGMVRLDPESITAISTFACRKNSRIYNMHRKIDHSIVIDAIYREEELAAMVRARDQVRCAE